MYSSGQHPSIHIEYPRWIDDVVDWNRPYRSDEDKMRLAIEVSRVNVERETGGPFGAAIYTQDTGRLIAVGMNSVVRLNNCTLHGEMVAFMMAQQRVGSFTLKAPVCPRTSSSPRASPARCASAPRCGAACGAWSTARRATTRLV